MTRTAKITVGVIVLLIAGAIGAAFLLFEKPQKGTIVDVAEPTSSIAEATDAPQPSSDASTEPETSPELEPEEPTTEQAEIDETPEPVVPKFDVVRIDVDGSTVVAGQAAPGATVEILLDGDVIATETADGAGQFVSIFSVTVTGEPRQLVLRAAGEEAETELAGVDVADATNQTQETASEETTSDANDAPDADDAPVELAGSEPSTAVADETYGTSPEGQASGDEGTLVQPELETASTDELPNLETDDAIVQTAPAPVDENEGATLAANEPSGSQEAEAVLTPVEDTVQAQREIGNTQATSVESAPVLILPGATDGTAPTIVQPGAEELALLQPSATASEVPSVRLDRISYSVGGAVDLLGRATPGNTIRVYANALLATETSVVPAGQWRASLDASTGQAAKLLRVDEIDPSGKVVSRVETPFVYEIDDGPKTLRQRTVEIERGDHLWRIAEQYYGEGLRYSLIFSANSELIQDPDLIYPGQVFTVPQLVDGE